MDPWDGAQARAAKALMGRPLRVLLGAWILSRGDRSFFQTEAQDAMRPYREAPSGVKAELDRLAGLEMLTRFADERRVWFTRADSPYWPIFEAAAVAFGLLQRGSGSGGGPTRPERIALKG